MRFCANCGSLDFSWFIFCHKCFKTPKGIYLREHKDYSHYYFYEWDSYAKILIEGLKYGRQQKTLDFMASYFRYHLPKFTCEHVYVAPNSKLLKTHNNHAYLFAKSLGLSSVADVFKKQGEQKTANQMQRRSIRIEGPKILCNEALLIDDVVTTGSTIQAMLKHITAKKVYVISMAYVPKHRLKP